MTEHISLPGFKDQNGRTYPKGEVTRAVAVFEETVRQKSALGELGIAYGRTIDLANVSHRIDSIWVEDDGIHFTAVPLNTPRGAVLASLLDEQAVVPNLRSEGTISENIVAGLKIYTIDFVERDR